MSASGELRMASLFPVTGSNALRLAAVLDPSLATCHRYPPFPPCCQGYSSVGNRSNVVLVQTQKKAPRN